jgi:hypothetical protein
LADVILNTQDAVAIGTTVNVNVAVSIEVLEWPLRCATPRSPAEL